jgi:hypothetical protein
MRRGPRPFPASPFVLYLNDRLGALGYGCGKLAQRQEGSLLSTNIDESSTETTVDADDAAEIDIADAGLSLLLVMELDQAVILEQSGPSMITADRYLEVITCAIGWRHYLHSSG